MRTKSIPSLTPDSFKAVFRTRTKAWKKYYQLIQQYYYRPRFSGCHAHHIMPRCAYKYGYCDGKNVNSEYNLVYVNKYEHMVLHYLLMRCSSSAEMKGWMRYGWEKLNRDFGAKPMDLDKIIFGRGRRHSETNPNSPKSSRNSPLNSHQNPLIHTYQIY